MTRPSTFNRQWPYLVLLLAVIYMLVAPALHQDETYHLFADGRTLLGIPYFWNVVSNLPFAVVGFLGLWRLRGLSARILFLGVLLTCVGSAYYHWAPSDTRLVYDRLPMTLVFMAFLAHIMAEDAGSHLEMRLVLLLVTAGIGSVVWWRITGDLRPYAVVQFGPLLLLLPKLRTVHDAKLLGSALGFYVLAKLAEHYDGAIYSIVKMGGHAWKHVLAGLASCWIFRWWQLETDLTPGRARHAH